MELGERDPHTGKMTTGHEWNGIKELDTPVPKPVLFFLGATILFAILWTALMPAWPTVTGYTKGLLGVDQKTSVEASIAAATAERAAWSARIASEDFAAIEADPALMSVVREAGATLFGDNCAACHGARGEGNTGYPNIAQAPTLWGDDPATILETIRVGINSSHPETRYSQMLAFGRDQMLQRDDIHRVVAYVRGLSDPTIEDPDGVGAQIFADNCAGCHGASAEGMTDGGAPNLTDPFWIYGGDAEAVFTSVYYGRQGHMPTWEGRLSETDLKLLAVYVHDLRSGS